MSASFDYLKKNKYINCMYSSICLVNISKDCLVDNMKKKKKTELTEYVHYFFN